MPPDPPRGYRLRRAFIRTPLRQILDPPQFTDVIGSSVPIFAKKKQKLWSHTKEHAIYGPGLRLVFCFFMRTVRSQTGTKATRVGSVTEMKLDRSEFIFRSVNA